MKPFLSCESARGGGVSCTFPARCIDCVTGETYIRLTRKNAERKKRGEDDIPIPEVSQSLVLCTNAFDPSTDRECAGSEKGNMYCLPCCNHVRVRDGKQEELVMHGCKQCERVLCLPCRKRNKMDEIRFCFGCQATFCRGCNPITSSCPNCKAPYCSISCGNKLHQPCLICEKSVCARCDPRYNTECKMCGDCYKPCTNPNCFKVTDTKRCGECRITRYCSKECQIAVWAEHKMECSKLRAEKDQLVMQARANRSANKKDDVLG